MSEVFDLDPKICDTCPLNPKLDPRKCEVLKRSIASQGLLQPGKVFRKDKNGRHTIATGHKRWWSCLELEIPFRAEILDEDYSPKLAIPIIMHENGARQSMSAEAQCTLVLQFMDIMGLQTQAEAARELGMSESQISRILSQLGLPEPLKHYLGKVSPSLAYVICTLKNTEDMQVAFERALNEKLSRDRVQTLVNDLKAARGGATRKPAPVDLKFNDRRVRLWLSPGDGAEVWAKLLRGLAAKLTKNPDTPPEGWRFVL